MRSGGEGYSAEVVGGSEWEWLSGVVKVRGFSGLGELQRDGAQRRTLRPFARAGRYYSAVFRDNGLLISTILYQVPL